MSTRGLSPDRLVELEQERDFLLASLADLEAEHAAGDLDDADFEQLHADYTVRTADLIRQIEERNAQVSATAPTRSRSRTIAWVVALMVFGGISYATLPAQEDPKITIREAIVTTRYPGLTPERVDEILDALD